MTGFSPAQPSFLAKGNLRGDARTNRKTGTAPTNGADISAVVGEVEAIDRALALVPARGAIDFRD
jgi:hypothetical protein